MRQGSIPRRFTRGIVKLLRKNKHGGDGISNFHLLTMLNTDLEILAKTLANCLQTVLPSLICPEQTCAVKGRTIQNSLHLVRTIVEKVDGNATLINLDQSKAFDRVDHAFLEAVLSVAGFRLHFCAWIHLLFASTGVMVVVNGVRLEPYTLTQSIHQGCPLSPMLYILALEPFLCKLKANPALGGLMLPGSSEIVRYTAYADNVSVLLTSNAKVEEVSKEIGRYEAVTGTKIDRKKSIGLWLGWWKGCALSGPFIWKDGPCKILSIWFGSNLQLEKNWSEVLEKIIAATELLLRRQLSLKGQAEVYCSHIYSLIVYWFSGLPIPYTILFKLERILFQFIWAKRFPLVQQEICYLHQSEGGLGVPNVETRYHTLCLTFLDRMCSQDTPVGSFWKEDAKQSFPLPRSVHSTDGETHRLPRRECPFYRECRHALKVLSWLQTGLSDSRPLYHCLVRGATSSGLISKLGVTDVEGRLLWPWVPVSIMMRLPSPCWSSRMPSGSAARNFQHNRPLRWLGGVSWPHLLSLPGRATTVQASWKLHGSHPQWKVLCPGSQFCVKQCGTKDKQIGTLCVSLLTWHYVCCDLDDEKEGTLRGWVFFSSNFGVFF